MDSVSEGIDDWMAQMPSADRGVEELRQRVARLSRLFEKLLEKVALDHRISRADWTALAVIVRNGDRCTPTELAEALELTSGTVSTRIKRLTEAGLIEFDGSATDARSRPVKTTRAGYEHWQSATALRTVDEARLVRSAVDDDSLAMLNTQLAMVLERFEAQLGAGGNHDLPR